MTMLPWLLFSKAFCDTSQRYTFITPGPYSHLRRQFIILELQKDFFTLVHPLPVEQGWISCYPGGPPGQRPQFTQHNSHLQTQPALNRALKFHSGLFRLMQGVDGSYICLFFFQDSSHSDLLLISMRNTKFALSHSTVQ